MLPEDLKNFYLMTNGFHMTWNVKLDGESAFLLWRSTSLAESLEETVLRAFTTQESEYGQCMGFSSSAVSRRCDHLPAVTCAIIASPPTSVAPEPESAQYLTGSSS